MVSLVVVGVMTLAAWRAASASPVPASIVPSASTPSNENIVVWRPDMSKAETHHHRTFRGEHNSGESKPDPCKAGAILHHLEEPACAANSEDRLLTGQSVTPEPHIPSLPGKLKPDTIASLLGGKQG